MAVTNTAEDLFLATRHSKDKLAFVLHLGDFIYELMWYPEERATYYDRKVRDLVRYTDGEKHEDFHVPPTVACY